MEKIANNVADLATENTKNVNTDTIHNPENQSKIGDDASAEHDADYGQINNVQDKNDPWNSYLSLLNKFNEFKIETQLKIQDIENEHKNKIKELHEELREYSYKTAVLEFNVASYKKLNLIIAKLNEIGIYLWHRTKSAIDDHEAPMMFNQLTDSQEIKVVVCLWKENISKFNAGILEINKGLEPVR